MSSRAIYVFEGLEALLDAGTREFVRCAREAIVARGRFTVALSGGSTPKPLYQRLSAEPFRSEVDWNRVEIFWGDERCVPPDHLDSNFRMAREAMLDRLPIPKGQIHRIETERADRETAARDYEAVLSRVFGVSVEGEPPAFDLILLGMGPDGHTASLFPGTKALDETVRWVVVNHVPKFNTDRLTMTKPLLNRAREVLFLVAGGDKAEVLAEVLNGPADPIRLPSQTIRPAGKLVWYVEQSAAGKLDATQVSRMG